LAVSEEAINAILVVEQAKEQIAVYYVSHALAGAEINYPLIEKFAYALVMASQKLRPYFEAYRVIILNNQRLKKRPTAARRLRSTLKVGRRIAIV